MISTSSSPPLPLSPGSFKSNITRSSRETFVTEFEHLPPEFAQHKPFYEPVEGLDEDTEELSEADVKIQQGLERIRKLDKILQQKCAHEKEITKERLLREQKFEEEVKSLIENKGNICGSQQLLCLCKGVGTIAQEPIEPIFATEINVEDRAKAEDPATENIADKQTCKSQKDFLKRNIQLAGRAQDAVLITEEEQKHIEKLLLDDRDLLLQGDPFGSDTVSNIPFSYRYSAKDFAALNDIDSKLKDLVPEIVYELSILGNQARIPADVSTSETQTCGEKALQETQVERVLKLRLQDIEEKLEALKVTEGAMLDPDVLRRLLDVDSRLTSNATSICESFASTEEIESSVHTESVT